MIILRLVTNWIPKSFWFWVWKWVKGKLKKTFLHFLVHLVNFPNWIILLLKALQHLEKYYTMWKNLAQNEEKPCLTCLLKSSFGWFWVPKISIAGTRSVTIWDAPFNKVLIISKLSWLFSFLQLLTYF